MTDHFLAAFRAGQASRNGHGNNRANNNNNNNAGGNTNRNNLPRAPWLTDDEWQSLRDRGHCTRCLGNAMYADVAVPTHDLYRV